MDLSSSSFIYFYFFIIFTIFSKSHHNNGMACTEMTVCHACSEKLLWYQGIFQFQIPFTKGLRSYCINVIKKLRVYFRLKDWDKVLFSCTQKKVAYEMSPEEESIFAFDSIYFRFVRGEYYISMVCHSQIRKHCWVLMCCSFKDSMKCSRSCV